MNSLRKKARASWDVVNNASNNPVRMVRQAAFSFPGPGARMHDQPLSSGLGLVLSLPTEPQTVMCVCVWPWSCRPGFK